MNAPRACAPNSSVLSTASSTSRPSPPTSKTLVYRKSQKGGGYQFVQVDLATLDEISRLRPDGPCQGPRRGGRPTLWRRQPAIRPLHAERRPHLHGVRNLGLQVALHARRLCLREARRRRAGAVRPKAWGRAVPSVRAAPDRPMYRRRSNRPTERSKPTSATTTSLSAHRARASRAASSQLRWRRRTRPTTRLAEMHGRRIRRCSPSRACGRAQERYVNYIESSPDEQKQPVLTEMFYIKPGDVLTDRQPVLFDVVTGEPGRHRPHALPQCLFAVRTELVEGRSRFLHQLQPARPSGLPRHRGEPAGRPPAPSSTSSRRPSSSTSTSACSSRSTTASEIVWMSERDGWCHLYLYDGVKGVVKNQITKGQWAVRAVVHVDEEKRQIWFYRQRHAAGRGSLFRPLLPHQLRRHRPGRAHRRRRHAHASRSRRTGTHYVDIWSRVDLAPVAELRRASDGEGAAGA